MTIQKCKKNVYKFFNFSNNCFAHVFPGQETLLHFATRLGFSQLATFLLDQPGADSALSMRDKDGKSPEEIAGDRGMRLLVDALKR